MVNDTRSSQKTKEDEVGSSKKKPNDTVPGDASGLRRSARGQSTSSPVTPSNVRKSERIEKRTPPKPSSSSSSMKKKVGDPSPLRRSERDNKSNTSSSKGSPYGKGGSKQHGKVSNTPDAVKEKREKQDKTLKDAAVEGRDDQQNGDDEVGNKRKRRLNARLYREMFKPLKKVKVPESESGKNNESKNSEDGGSEKAEEEKQEHSDEEGSKREYEKDVDDDADDDDAGVSISDDNDNDNVDGNKPSELEDRDDVHVARGHNVSTLSSHSNEAAENSDKTEDVPGHVVEIGKHGDQEMPLASTKLSDDGNGSGCRDKGMTVGASAVESEGMAACPSDDVILETQNASEECVKCFRKRRLNHDTPQQELCCCLSSTVSDIDNVKDRSGTCIVADFAEENGQNVKQSDSPLDDQRSICFICKHAGKLLHCCGKGCSQSYHPSCSSNPEENIYLANWYCIDCTKKRFAFGVHSVSQGIESILGVREVGVPNLEGKPNQKQKQCFVKYKGLAHVHNCWISETQLLHEAPEHCVKLGMQREDTQWNPDWAVPHRLLQRRSVIDDRCHRPIDQEVSCMSNNQHEWLVKWRGLDYNHATWELENSSFMKRPEAQRLMEEYEARHNKAKGVPFSGSIEVQERRRGSDSSYLNSVNKLREFHHKGHNAVLFDEQERVVKVIHLVSSLVTNVCRPFLIITQHAYLSSWEAEFVRKGVSMNVVVYGGNADARYIIRCLEFYGEGGQVMLQVLLSTAETVAEDVEELKGIVWEAVIIDDCQKSSLLAHSGCIMNMATAWRLLLINAQLKDNAVEYFKILSLLESGDSFNQKDGSVFNSNEDIKVLKDRLSSFVVCSSFLEYWVPVEISNLQLEQYCHSMLSNSSVLRSVLKTDPMNTLRDILIPLRKCCDHPYIADLQLQPSLAGGLSQDAMMDLGIKASGKLYLLEKLLSELKNIKMKVLILFQPTGASGRDYTGYILEDFLRWRFGPDSYEHIASGLIPSKKQAACHQFNSLRERSFFLLEARSCSATIKFSLLDAVIIFDSDWNPQNDLKALQKIIIDSKLEQIKVFRLYCPCTIEEKILILSKNEMTLSSLQNILPSTSHLLMMWGSSYLFSRLEEFHRQNDSDCKNNIVFGSSFFSDVSEEVISLFQKSKIIDANKYISVARQSVGCYLKCIPLIGEQKIQREDGLAPLNFWTKLLEGKHPHWKYFSGSSQRNRKRVQYSEAPSSEVQNDEAAKKCRKIDSTKMDPFSQQAELSQEKLISGNKENQERCGASMAANLESMEKDSSSRNNIVPVNREFDNIKVLHDEQRGLIDLLKQKILRLCEALPLEDDGKRLAERFLGYLVKNFRVPKNPENTLQALLLSVCWTAAEELNMKIDHKKSLSIARERMGFNCSECEAEDIYSKLKPKMEMHLRSGITNLFSKGNSVELEESSLGADCLKKQGVLPVQIDKGVDMKKLERGCNKQLEKLRDKHKEEIEEFEKSWEEKRMKLEKWCKVESAAIRVTHANSSVGIDKLRTLDSNYAKKREGLEADISICRKELEARQQIEKDELQMKIAGYMERAKSLGQRKLFEESPDENRVKPQVLKPFQLGNDSNQNMCINKNLPTQENSESKSSKTLEAGRESISSVLPGHLDNSDKQRDSDNDNSKNTSDDLPASKGANTNALATEGPGCADLVKSKDSHCFSEKHAAQSASGNGGKECPPEQPSAPEQYEKVINHMDDVPAVGVVADRSTTLASNEISGGTTTGSLLSPDGVVADRSTALASNEISGGTTTGSLLSPVDSVTKQLSADVRQGLGENSCNRLGEQVQHYTGFRNTLTSGETPSTNFSNHVPSDLPSNEGTGGNIEYSFDEWVTHSGVNNQVRVASDNGANNVSSGSHTCNGATSTLMHQNHYGASVLGEAISQPLPQLAVDHSVDSNNVQNGSYVSLARGSVTSLATHPNRLQMPVSNVSRVPAPHNLDPLQIEIEGICRDMNNFINFHEQKKSQLKSECEKEIEELAAQVRSKYEKKLEEAEKAFSHKKNELQNYLQKVRMNKILAEAFRSKCTEYKTGPKMQQLGLASHSVESSSRPPFTRPFTAAGSFSAPPNTVASSSSAPPVHGVRPSTILGPPVRFPHIAPTAVPQQQVRSEVRGPAPHFQAFRSASHAMSSCSVPSGTLLMAQASNSPTSASLPQSIPLPSPSAHLNHLGQSSQEEAIGGTLLLSNKSATELILDIARQSEANLRQFHGNMPPLPDNVRHYESRDLSQLNGITNLQSPTTSVVPGDLVCLSDDE